MLNEMDKEMKMKLLMQLIDSMDESVGERLSKKDISAGMEEEPMEDPIAVVEEKSVMPASALKEKLMSKLEEGEGEEEENTDDDDLLSAEKDEDEPMSRLQRRIAEGKKFHEMKKR